MNEVISHRHMDTQESLDEQIEKMFEDIRQGPESGDTKIDGFFDPKNYTTDDISLYWKTVDIVNMYRKKVDQRTFTKKDAERIVGDIQSVVNYYRQIKLAHENQNNRGNNLNIKFKFSQYLLNRLGGLLLTIDELEYTF